MEKRSWVRHEKAGHEKKGKVRRSALKLRDTQKSKERGRSALRGKDVEKIKKWTEVRLRCLAKKTKKKRTTKLLVQNGKRTNHHRGNRWGRAFTRPAR